MGDQLQGTIATLLDCIGSAVDLDTALEVAGGIFGNETLPDLSIVEPNSDAPTFIPGSLTLAVFERFRATYGVPPTSSDAFIPADALRFGNPHWHDKVRKLLKAGTVGLDLRGLLLSTAGSAGSVPFNQGADGTLIVTVPSQFEGGDVVAKLDDGGQTVHAMAKRSAYDFQYEVLPHRPGCWPEVGPISSGCRVALIYDIFEYQGALQDRRDVVVQELREALLGWTNGPRQLALHLMDSFELADSRSGKEVIPRPVRFQIFLLRCTGLEEQGYTFRIACLTCRLEGLAQREGYDGSNTILDHIVIDSMQLDDFRGVDGLTWALPGGEDWLNMRSDELLEKRVEEIFDGELERPEHTQIIDSRPDDDEDVYRVQQIFKCNVLLLIRP